MKTLLQEYVVEQEGICLSAFLFLHTHFDVVGYF